MVDRRKLRKYRNLFKVSMLLNIILICSLVAYWWVSEQRNQDIRGLVKLNAYCEHGVCFRTNGLFIGIDPNITPTLIDPKQPTTPK